jgi:hypothetical protein
VQESCQKHSRRAPGGPESGDGGVAFFSRQGRKAYSFNHRIMTKKGEEENGRVFQVFVVYEFVFID